MAEPLSLISVLDVETTGFPPDAAMVEVMAEALLSVVTESGAVTLVGPPNLQLPNIPSPLLYKGVLYMINAGTRRAPDLVRRLLDLNIELTVTVGRDKRLQRAIEAAAGDQKIEILGWTDQLPRLLCQSHLLIGKAGGAAVQEAIAAKCPMIINHIVSGQEEGNAQLLVETNSGAIARSNDEVIAQVERAFADEARQWREWASNISVLSRPCASLEIAEFLLAL